MLFGRMSDSPSSPVRLFGRSSSHFTRIARIFAAETGIEYSFEVVRDLLSRSAGDFGGNPSLKIPVLHVGSDTWFGALNVCRALSRESKRNVRIVWPEDLVEPSLANAQELVLQGMATEVTLILSKLGGERDSPHQAKLAVGLTQVLAWLEANAAHVVAKLPPSRDVSYLEVALFCFVTHLEFRKVLPVSDYPVLEEFATRFGERASARETGYAFD
jgi:glutathione S-transferase